MTTAKRIVTSFAGIVGTFEGPPIRRKRKPRAWRPYSFRQRTLVRKSLLTPPKPRELVVHRKGPRRLKVGVEDPLESFAVSHEAVAGTLPERIFYKALLARGYRPEVDFDFQSSQMGGRLELGGVVADFLFPSRRLVVQIQTLAWHTGFEAERNDSQDRQLLEIQGFAVLDCWESTVYNPTLLDDWMRRYLTAPTLGGYSFYGSVNEPDDEGN